jgi:Spy/CpxP family protein refolding chaperone
MLKHKMVVGLLGAALFVALCATGVALAGAPGGGGAGGGGAGGGGRGAGGGQAFDPAQMRARQVTRIMDQLAVGDQERPVIEPLVAKVVELSAQVRPGMGGGMRGGRGGQPGAAAPADTTRQLSPVEKATQALQTTLDNESASPEAIKAGLKALRDAREQAKQDLAKAQDQLRQVLSVRQEAQLVLMGLLD